jgi:hypothetical protein
MYVPSIVSRPPRSPKLFFPSLHSIQLLKLPHMKFQPHSACVTSSVGQTSKVPIFEAGSKSRTSGRMSILKKICTAQNLGASSCEGSVCKTKRYLALCTSGTGDRCYDFKNIFAEKFGVFDSKYC